MGWSRDNGVWILGSRGDGGLEVGGLGWWGLGVVWVWVVGFVKRW